MRMFNLSFALLAAVAVAIAAAPADAATKKKAKTSKAKATTSQPVFVSQFNSCTGAASQMWLPLAAAGSIGCGVVYAVPITVEGFMNPRPSRA